jgi:L-lysine exporter family protein LysE/ArgO
MLEIVSKGALISGSMIVAIGSQNAFVLKQGLLKNNIFYVCLLCFVCDFSLMSIGVMGLGNWINNSQTLTNVLALGGAVFLIYYGSTAFISSYNGSGGLDVSNYKSENNKEDLMKVLLATLAVTLLNPHVYLDTVVVVGGVAGTFNSDEKIFFLIGALIASSVWFFSLGYGARLLAPLFKKPSTWRIFDFIIGCIMFFISITLIRYALQSGS